LGNFYLKFSFFSHNFRTRNARKLIKGSKDLDFNLVSIKNLSKILSTIDWGPGPDNLGQKGLNLPYLRCHPQKTETQNLKFFCIEN